eukprot:1154614-Pelagomonas_calceolata.AAC.2
MEATWSHAPGLEQHCAAWLIHTLASMHGPWWHIGWHIGVWCAVCDLMCGVSPPACAPRKLCCALVHALASVREPFGAQMFACRVCRVAPCAWASKKLCCALVHGGTMRLGSRKTVLQTVSCTSAKLYQSEMYIYERHRHRWVMGN